MKEKVNRDEFGFYIALTFAVLLTFYLPFTDCSFEWSIHSLLVVLGTAACKLVELKTLAEVLKELTAFELKAWLGMCVFISYFIDILWGNDSFSIGKILLILVTIVGLLLIVMDRNRKIDYRKIAFTLVLYLASRLLYGVAIRSGSGVISSTLVLYLSLWIVCLFTGFKAHPMRMLREGRRALGIISVTRIINIVGSIAENVVITVSLVQYFLIQPGILVVLFFIKVFSKEEVNRRNLIGSILCILGIVGFTLL
jgi:hypothetical protein